MIVVHIHTQPGEGIAGWGNEGTVNAQFVSKKEFEAWVESDYGGSEGQKVLLEAAGQARKDRMIFVIAAAGTHGAAALVGVSSSVALTSRTIRRNNKISGLIEENVTAGNVKEMNSGSRKLGVGGTRNCVNNAIGVDLQLAGRPNSAMPMAPLTNGTYADIAQPLIVIENFYKGRTFSVLNGGMEGIAKTLTKDGDRAIIYGKYANGEGHVLNAVRQNGKINLLDGQVGSGGTISNFTEMKILKTN